jgi:DNA-binding NtrC family response regulator
MNSNSEEKFTVLVVDDDESVRAGLRWLLADSYEICEAASREEALDCLKEQNIDVVLTDLCLPPDTTSTAEGLAIIKAANRLKPPVPVIVITAAGSRKIALEAVEQGATAFLEKPFNDDAILHLVAQTARTHQLEEEVLRLKSELKGERGFEHLIGISSTLEKLIKQARAVADTTATVLVTGENGTGKEMVARSMHEESPRAAAPFVAVSCAALPESLIESELFGHEKGAFTGATQARKGRFELADGGTLFLDEIGELTPAIQVKLLRVLQEREFERVGGTRTIKVDIRLIAASNRDLDQEVEAGRFRQDLFYRLNVVPLVLPPLRQRAEDIPLLAVHFATKAAEKHGRSRPELEPSLIEALLEYDWPGNVRELENLMERLVVLTRDGALSTDFLPEKMQRAPKRASASDETTFDGAVATLKRKLVVDALKAEHGNKVAAARRLGISRSYLHRLISDFEIHES